jgi:cephalosporin hydroxylase
MTYKEVKGYCDFHDFYREMFNELPEGGVFVELGSYMGHSVIFMATLAKETGKNIEIHDVDTFKGSKEHKNKDFFNDYYINVKECGVADYINTHIGRTDSIVDLFKDNSIDFLFIDASHEYEDVKNDIKLWSPKVKGIISGHDYCDAWPGVVRAVDECYPNAKKTKSVWYYDTNGN